MSKGASHRGAGPGRTGFGRGERGASGRKGLAASGVEVLEPRSPSRRAYEQVADQIRARIDDGTLQPGTRLPTEEALAEQFDTSRSTIREALRLLEAWHLVRVVVGRNGGAYVARPDVAHVANVIGGNVALLTSSESVMLEAVLEARQLIEVPAAGLAAARCTDEAVEAISAALVTDPSAQSADEQFEKDQRFHIEVLQATANPMVVIATQPLLDVIRAKVERLPRRRDFREAICRDHLAIYEALAGHDAKRACREMQRHLDYLRPFYAKAESVGALQRARA
ncbi:MAG: FadR/GntR family transcriptional regulator [Actinomycetia bacterium]|nr:FadR/GntR family transcriptional regulator [Actinomycetes bacterium]